MYKISKWLIIGAFILVGCTLNPSPLPTVIEDVSVYSTQIIQPSDIPESEPTTGPQISEIIKYGGQCRQFRSGSLYNGAADRSGRGWAIRGNDS